MSVPLSRTLVHDPSDVLDYSMDWTDVLATGETISATTWAVAGGAATIADTYNGTAGSTATGTTSGSTTTVWVVTASPGDVSLRHRITTSAGRTYERTATLQVQDQ